MICTALLSRFSKFWKLPRSFVVMCCPFILYRCSYEIAQSTSMHLLTRTWHYKIVSGSLSGVTVSLMNEHGCKYWRLKGNLVVSNSFNDWLYCKHKSTSTKDGKSLGSSTILVQDGLDIQELPVIVKKTSDVLAVVGSTSDKPENSSVLENKNLEKDTIDVDLYSYLSENKRFDHVKVEQCDIDLMNIQTNLEACLSTKQLLAYLRDLPLKEVSSSVALAVLERLIELKGVGSDEISLEDISPEHTLYSVIIYRLCELVSSFEDINAMLAGLGCVLKGRMDEEEKRVYVECFVQDCLYQVSDGKLSILQTCELVNLLHRAGGDQQVTVDKLWSSIVDSAEYIDEKNILTVFGILPCFKTSQAVVLRTLMKRVELCYLKLTGTQVALILQVVSNLRQRPYKLLSVLTRWTNLNLHTLSEKEFKDIVRFMNRMKFRDSGLDHAVERYMKTKGLKCQNTGVVRVVSEYCTLFRWRNTKVLECLAAVFIKHGKKISRERVESIVHLFGLLNHQPACAFEFFENLENLLLERFADFKPQSIIEILMSCIYLQRYPLNFVKKVMSPFFLDRLNVSLADAELQWAHKRLKLLDAALSLECHQYRGPFFPKNLSAKSIHKDGRLLKLKTSLNDCFSELLGGGDRFKFSFVIPRLPLSDLYIIDYFFHLNKAGYPLPLCSPSGIYKRVAVLVHLPEHYCLNTDHLIGPQSMRERHLHLLGYEVIHLNYEALDRLNSQPERLDYLKKHLVFPFSSLSSKH
ncbi:LOW QUALITY PROTEIN: FAST kinase domain-containing protein 3, mitochondrial-like [Tachypleus tridentatus]|uniref:LOW QUALITY PROTEIN: FAST kinase domain-containing protein 3, mitochondrial-like n=1 Tax=Tachypleus tridentatus TaxID=6853 RepID=UPI003FD37BA6